MTSVRKTGTLGHRGSVNSGEVSKSPAEDVVSRPVFWKTSEGIVSVNAYTPQMVMRGRFSKSQDIWLQDDVPKYRHVLELP
jgi:hypothetical protein